MSGPAVLVHDDRLTRYDFGPGHPMAPLRVELTVALARALGVLDLPDLRVEPAPTASDDELALVHTPAFIEAVKAAGERPTRPDPVHGLGTEDTPCFAGMHDASALVAGATLAAARGIVAGEVLHGLNVSGGLHHAMPDHASGFCVYNDPAIAIAWMLRNGCERVAYVDVDVHHGDGVQAAFYDDPRVLTISLHETPQTLFPGTGLATETGGPGAEGTAANVALPPGTDDAGWLRAFHAVVPPLLREFEPDVLVSQHGCDSHRDDPLAHLMLTVDGQRAAQLALHDLAHELCGGRWLATGGGGYAVVEVVPRAWTHLIAIVGGRPVEPTTEIPAGWRDRAQASGRRLAPALMTDGATPRHADWGSGYNPDSWLDRSIHQTRECVFPLLGIDPSY